MPYQLVRKLEDLMSMPFDAEPNTILGSSVCVLPDLILDQIDAIADTAHNTFGSRVRPTQQQDAILKKHGFEIKPHNVTCGVWQSAVIDTPRGMIRYW